MRRDEKRRTELAQELRSVRGVGGIDAADLYMNEILAGRLLKGRRALLGSER